MKDLLTSKELAELLSLTETTIRMWRLRKIGPPYVKFGRSVRYQRSDIEEYMKRVDPKKDDKLN